jgi:MoaA/NifB/PqqE/SkfB family radical SAM enzyme
MPGIRTNLAALGTAIRHPGILKAGPRLNDFLFRYLRKFRVRKRGRNLIVHSHLPPLQGRAYSRFIREHLLNPAGGPSHAQVGLTNACPQRCVYCYNRDRKGTPMTRAVITRVIRELRDLGVVWMGWTGGEPLLNPDIVDLTAQASPDCAVKLFTTGWGLTPRLARDLRDAGLFSVSVSLDHWEEALHDRNRRFPGAFQAALRALRIFLELGDLDVGVSAVISQDLIRERRVEEYLDFLQGLGIHEAWLSETKPSVHSFCKDSLVAAEPERRYLAELQDRRNQRRGMTVNYLGHFEAGEHFGCNAGNKMIYVDAFGGVSPCVFTPLEFGNVNARPLAEIYQEMKGRFTPGRGCFMNRNYKLFQDFAASGEPFVSGARTAELMSRVTFGPPPRYSELMRSVG